MADWQYAGSDALGTSADTVYYNQQQQEPLQAPYTGSIAVKQIAVNGVLATMQLDTQSIVTRISVQLWEELKSLRLIDDKPSACEVTCPSGKIVRFVGMAHVVISIAGTEVETPAFVSRLDDDVDLLLAANVLSDIPLWKELWEAIGMEDLVPATVTKVSPAPAAVAKVSPTKCIEPTNEDQGQRQPNKKTKRRSSMPCMFAQLGCCRNGDSCPFNHGEPPRCKHFDKGHCRVGKFCLFKHALKRNVAPKTRHSRTASEKIEVPADKASSPGVKCVNQHKAVLGTTPNQGPLSPLRANKPVCRHYFEGKLLIRQAVITIKTRRL